jgi:hypothetical protein
MQGHDLRRRCYRLDYATATIFVYSLDVSPRSARRVNAVCMPLWNDADHTVPAYDSVVSYLVLF